MGEIIQHCQQIFLSQAFDIAVVNLMHSSLWDCTGIRMYVWPAASEVRVQILGILQKLEPYRPVIVPLSSLEQAELNINDDMHVAG